MREAILAFFASPGGDPAKYHETLTRAWPLAVRHFMTRTPRSDSFETWIANNPVILDSKIMMTHSSTDIIMSDRARATFIEPNLDPIPGYID